MAAAASRRRPLQSPSPNRTANPCAPTRTPRGDADLVSGPNGERPDWWWTGRRPEAGAPGVQPDGTVTSLPAPNLATVTRQQALEYFENTWLLTEVLFSALQGESAAQASAGAWQAAWRLGPCCPSALGRAWRLTCPAVSRRR